VLTFKEALPAIVLVVVFILASLQKGTPLRKLILQSLLLMAFVSLLLFLIYHL
jgi:hypothetical protein